MPANYSKNIVYLSKAQYQELITNETLTVNGQTITYDDNDIYVTPQNEPITDVQINGASINTNGIVNIPVATTNTFGVVKRGQGLYMNNGTINLNLSTIQSVKEGTAPATAIPNEYQHMAVFYGLSKVAGVDLASVNDITLGVYPDTSKAAIQNMLGITDLISTEESSTATAAHAINSTFMMGGKLYKATAAIAVGDAVVEGTNCQVVKADEVFVKKTDYATNSTPGIVVPDNAGIQITSNGILAIKKAEDEYVRYSASGIRPLTPSTQHLAVFYGLAKAAGSDAQSVQTANVGTYPSEVSAAIRNMLGAAAASDIPSVPVQDVQVNGTSILSNGIANVTILPVSANCLGYDSQGLYVTSALNVQIKEGTSETHPIVPAKQHRAVFYGLSKAAGVDMSSSYNTVGTYTETAKSAIRNMLGATSSNVIAVQDEQPTDSDTKVWLPETEAQGIQVPTYAEHQALASTVAGLPSDVQVNGTSVVSSGVANVPVGGLNTLGTVSYDNQYGNNGIIITSSGAVRTCAAADDQIKQSVNGYRPIVPTNQHKSVFYALAKAAGDTTQSASSNAVGTYTTEAKSAIQSMLGVESGVSFVENISGTTVSIIGEANTRYMCGELSTLSITPPSVGTIDIVFISGSTPTSLTVPNTVQFPSWFDYTSLDANATYEINIMDGIYGAVMVW